VSLINLGTRNFFDITIFRTRHISATCTGSYRSTPLMASSAATFLFQMTLSYEIHWQMHLQLQKLVSVLLTTQMLDCVGDLDLILPPFPRVELSLA